MCFIHSLRQVCSGHRSLSLETLLIGSRQSFTALALVVSSGVGVSHLPLNDLKVHLNILWTGLGTFLEVASPLKRGTSDEHKSFSGLPHYPAFAFHQVIPPCN